MFICVTQIIGDISLPSLSMTIWSIGNYSLFHSLKKKNVPFTIISSLHVFLVDSLKFYDPECININVNKG